MSHNNKTRGLIAGAALLLASISYPLLHAAVDNSASDKAKSQYLVNSAIKLSADEKYVVYNHILNAAWEKDSTDAYTRYLKGSTVDDPERSVELMRPYVMKHMDDPYTAVPFATFLFDADHKDEALSIAAELVERMPENKELRKFDYFLSILSDSLDRAEREVDVLQQLGLDSDEVDEMRKKLIEAREDNSVTEEEETEEELDVPSYQSLEDYLAQHPYDGSTADELMNRYFEDGDTVKALQVVTTFEENNPDEFNSKLLRSNYALLLEDTVGSVEALRQSLDTKDFEPERLVMMLLFDDAPEYQPLKDEVFARFPMNEPLFNMALFSYSFNDRASVDSLLNAYPDIKLTGDMLIYTVIGNYLTAEEGEGALRVIDRAVADGLPADLFDINRLYAYSMLNDSENFMRQRNEILAKALPGVKDFDNLPVLEYLDMSTDVQTASNAYLVEAEYRKKKKDREGVFQAMRNALILNPINGEALNNYAFYVAEMSDDPQQLQEALEMSRRSLNIDPDYNKWDTFAWLLFLLGDKEDALPIMEGVVSELDDSQEGNAEFFNHMGDIYYANGRIDDAMNMWKKAYELDSSIEKLDRKIEEKKYIAKDLN